MPQEKIVHQVAASYRDTVSFRIHALLVADVVALLQLRRGVIGSAGTRQPTQCKAGAGADGSAMAAIDGRAGSGAEQCADSCAACPAVDRHAARSAPGDLFMRKLLANVIVRAELIETLSLSR